MLACTPEVVLISRIAKELCRYLFAQASHSSRSSSGVDFGPTSQSSHRPLNSISTFGLSLATFTSQRRTSGVNNSAAATGFGVVMVQGPSNSASPVAIFWASVLVPKGCASQSRFQPERPNQTLGASTGNRTRTQVLIRVCSVSATRSLHLAVKTNTESSSPGQAILSMT